MKTVVFDRDVLEVEIKPDEMLSRYRQLLAQEVKELLVVPDQLVHCPCPGCQSNYHRPAFDKFGLTYVLCDECGSVYVSPRPSEEALISFYRDSEASRYLRDHILEKTQETRRRELFRPRARWLMNVVDEYRPDARLAIVVGYHNHMLVEELSRLEENLFQVIVTNPLADIDFVDTKFSNVKIQPMLLKELASVGQADIFLAFDILDRCVDLDELFSAARKILIPGGLLLASTISISGFDLQVLWDRSTSIHPPERLNLLSTEGLMTLYKRYGFEALEFSTPGSFDVEIVQRAVGADPDGDWPRFTRYLVESRDENALRAFQEYLQTYRLSSFVRIALRKSV